MTEDAERKRDLILDRSVEAFSRYGFKKCSMEDIADAAGMSRPALYQHFRNKAEIFRAGSERMQMQGIAAARNVAGETLAARLGEMLTVYKIGPWRIIHTTPHGAEMVDLNAALAEDVTQEAMETMIGVLADAMAPHAATGRDVADAARLLSAAAWGAMERAETEAVFKADMRALGSIWAAAICQPPRD